ncbi:MAG: acyl-CoA/acyl-ACP dehydrogenase [Campylobacter sp.]|nr:acyl-CoA/acyl-ACP dehydrogenase [Campylobacter sp.]
MSQTYDNAKQFALSHILPYSKQIDENGEFPSESFKQMGEAGYFKILIPKEYGGMGLGLQEHADVCRAFAASCATAGLCYMMHNVALMCVLTHGSDELKNKIFKAVVDEKKFLALAYSELGSGTHFYMPDIKAEFDGENVKFNGIKSMVTSATYASFYLILTPSKKEGEIDNFLIPLQTQGLEFKQNTWQGLGMRGNVSCQMHLNDVKLDTSYRIGESGSGAKQVFEVVAPFFVTGLGAVYTGLAQNILDEAVAHTTQRKYTSGKALCEIESVQVHLSRIFTQTNAAIASVNEAAKAGANGDSDALAKILAARIFASETAIETARIAMRVGGGKTYNRQNGIERLLRDAYASQVMAPSVDVLNIWLGKAITGQMIP